MCVHVKMWIFYLMVSADALFLSREKPDELSLQIVLKNSMQTDQYNTPFQPNLPSKKNMVYFVITQTEAFWFPWLPLAFLSTFSDSSFFSARLIRITVVEQLKPFAKERGRRDIKWENPRNILLAFYRFGMGRGRIITPELHTHKHNESDIHKQNCTLKLLMHNLLSRALLQY